MPFRFDLAEAKGDTVPDFAGNGALAGDRMKFSGNGTAAQGASFTQLTVTAEQVSSANGLTQEVISFAMSCRRTKPSYSLRSAQVSSAGSMTVDPNA